MLHLMRQPDPSLTLRVTVRAPPNLKRTCLSGGLETAATGQGVLGLHIGFEL